MSQSAENVITKQAVLDMDPSILERVSVILNSSHTRKHDEL
jgi:hypothetical protein